MRERVPPNLDAVAAVTSVHADQLLAHVKRMDKLDRRLDGLDIQVAVWRGQLRLLAAIAGISGGVVGGAVAAGASALAG